MATTFKSEHTPAQIRLCSTYKNLGLWTFQGWIAMFFIAAGYAKLTESMENLTVLMHWPALASVNFVRGLGVVEIVLALMVLSPPGVVALRSPAAADGERRPAGAADHHADPARHRAEPRPGPDKPLPDRHHGAGALVPPPLIA